MLICGREVLRIKEAHNVSWDEAVSMYKAKYKAKYGASVGCRGCRVVALSKKFAQCFPRFGGRAVAKAIARDLGADWRSENAAEKCAKMLLR